MSDNHPLENLSMHQEITLLLPWYVNGTLDDLSRERVDAHVVGCPACRDDLSLEQRVFARIDGETAIDYVPVASLKRLQSQLGSLQAGAALPVQTTPQSNNGTPWRVLAAASVVAVTVSISVLLVERWVQLRPPAAQPLYHTVTNDTPQSRDAVIRAVFAPNITLVELQAILDEAQLRIISGPSEAGVYSLASNSDKPVRSSLAQLRRHSSVRFAEASRLEPGPGDPP
jgi:anti-sigma-K factor RskA